MSRSFHRIVTVLLTVSVLASAAWLQARAQVIEKAKAKDKAIALPAQPAPGPGFNPGGAGTTGTPGTNPDGFEYGGISLPKDEQHLNDKIEAAVDYIKEEDWKEVVPLLQKLLEIKEDVFARLKRKSPEGKDVFVWVSVKTEADRLIANLPPNGRDFYKLTYGVEAAKLLKKYRETGDSAVLAEIMKRYAHTDAGGEAINLLASYHLDRGNYAVAVRCYNKLFNREGADKLPPVVRFKAAYALHLAGAIDNSSSNQLATTTLNERELWKQLREQTREIAFANGDTMSVADLEDHVSKLERPTLYVDASDAPVFRGTPNRSNQLVGGAAFLVPRWKTKTLHTPEGVAQQKLKQAAKVITGDRHQPLLTSFFPITVTVTKNDVKQTLLVYKDYWGVNAINMKTGKLEWDSPSNWSLERMLGPRTEARKQQALTQWLQYYLDSNVRPEILFENSTVGSLSTDGKYVYVVEDLAVPPPPNLNPHMMNPGMMHTGFSPEIQDAIQHSRLQAFSLTTNGKLTWEVGEKGPLSDCYFLGAPLPLGGKLYVLTEKQQELRLVCLDPDAGGAIVSSQTLGTTHDKMQHDVTRRTQAAYLAYGEGILVCPTNAGAVFGINLLENSLVWAYPYREKGDAPAANGPMMGKPGGLPQGWVMGPDGRPMRAPAAQTQDWKVSAPVIQDGKVVFTAPDAKSIHCINLRDGSPVWSHKKAEDDLYLGNVYNGKVLIVGKKNARALSLSSGETLWTVETGMPSGQGIGSDHVYYLPLKEAGRAKEPEIAAIDMERGQVIAHTKSRPKTADGSDFEVPGNLLFCEGDVVSQTPWEVTAYPQLKVKIAQMDELIAKNPNDPIGLTERGDLRLDKGDLAGAIEDLSLALKNKPDEATRARARGKLYDTLTAYIQEHFSDAEKYLSEYEELCNVDLDAATTEKERAELQAEQRRRRSTFLWLVGKGREEQGRLVEAFEKYQEFGAVAGKGTQELVPAVDERAVKAAPDVWSRGRIIAMMAKAKPENREPLEKLIRSRWDKLQGTNDLEELRQFVRMFGPVSAAGKEARLELAERLVEQKGDGALLEAELELSHFRTGKESPELAARATEILARLYTRKGLLEDAAWCYRKLGNEHAKITIRDGMTGRDFYNEKATDKRILPHLDEPERIGGAGKLEQPKVDHGSFPMPSQVYQFAHTGEDLPFFQRYTLGLRFDNHELKLTDRGSGEDKWHRTVTKTMMANLVNANGQGNSLRFPFRSLGHLVVLPVGHMVYGLDAVTGEVKWERDLAAFGAGHSTNPVTPNGPQANQVLVDPHDNGLLLLYPDGWAQRLGQVGSLEGMAVCVQARDTLTALDPLTGRTLWARTDVNPRNALFADEDHVYVVELRVDQNVVSATGTRIFRAADGITVKAPDFTSLYQKRVQMFGRHLLVSEAGAGNAVNLRLYDVLTGQDVWKQTYPARSLVVRSEDPTLTGVVEPTGQVHVIDLKARKEVLSSKMQEPGHLANVQTVHLVADRENFYLACQAPVQDPNLMRFGGVQSNLMPNSGMRCVPVNGMLYAFEKGSGEIAWFVPATNQMLVLDQFEELPVVLLTSRYQKWDNGGFRNQVHQVVALMSVDKRTGKVLFENKDLKNATNFYAIHADARAGTIEFISHNLKLIHYLNGATPGKAENSTPAPATTVPVGGTGHRSLPRAANRAAERIGPLPPD